METMSVQPNERKLAELILYISQKYANDPYFGAVKLNKALFFPDFTAFASWGKTITGAEYQHLPEGPAVYRMLPVLDALIAEGALALQHVDFYGLPQKRTVNLRAPDLSHFSGREIAVVDGWLETLRPFSGTKVSKISHETASWRLTSDRERIDPRTVFIGWREPNAAEVRRGKELAVKYGLLVQSMHSREVFFEPEIEAQLSRIGVSYRRFDEVMDYVFDLLANHAEVFPVLQGTKISLCLTNEFVGNSFPDLPALSLYFHYDEKAVSILSVEESAIESYGMPDE